MKLKKIAQVITSRILCGRGLTLGSLGIIFSVWYFIFSSSENRFYCGGGAVILFIVGYLVYRFGNDYIYDEWDDYY